LLSLTCQIQDSPNLSHANVLESATVQVKRGIDSLGNRKNQESCTDLKIKLQFWRICTYNELFIFDFKMAETKTEVRIPLQYSGKISKPSATPQRKHIKNAKELETKKTQQFILLKLNSFLKQNQKLDLATCEFLFNVIKRVVESMAYEFDKNLLMSCLIYSDRYVHRAGRLDKNDVLQVLLLSVIVALKFSQDEGKIGPQMYRYLNFFKRCRYKVDFFFDKLIAKASR
jgi:hypothetical protein